MSSKSKYFILNKLQTSLIERLCFWKTEFTERNIASTGLSTFFYNSFSVTYKNNVDVDSIDIVILIQQVIKSELFDDLKFSEYSDCDDNIVNVKTPDDKLLGKIEVNVEFGDVLTTIEVEFDSRLIDYFCLNL